jgi:hypothetical protein
MESFSRNEWSALNLFQNEIPMAVPIHFPKHLRHWNSCATQVLQNGPFPFHPRIAILSRPGGLAMTTSFFDDDNPRRRY